MRGHHHHQSPRRSPAQRGPELTVRIAATLGIGVTDVNEVDFDDLYVSEEVMKVVGQLASSILREGTDAQSGPRVSAYWIEHTLELVLCADSGKDIHLVRVPEAHWTVKPRTYN